MFDNGFAGQSLGFLTEFAGMTPHQLDSQQSGK
jgi:hypothetical protein